MTNSRKLIPRKINSAKINSANINSAKIDSANINPIKVLGYLGVSVWGAVIFQGNDFDFREYVCKNNGLKFCFYHF